MVTLVVTLLVTVARAAAPGVPIQTTPWREERRLRQELHPLLTFGYLLRVLMVRVQCNPQSVVKDYGFHQIWHQFRRIVEQDSTFLGRASLVRVLE